MAPVRIHGLRPDLAWCALVHSRQCPCKAASARRLNAASDVAAFGRQLRLVAVKRGWFTSRQNQCRQNPKEIAMKPLILTAYVWTRKPYWLRHAGKIHKFRLIADAREYAEAHGRTIRVRFGG